MQKTSYVKAPNPGTKLELKKILVSDSSLHFTFPEEKVQILFVSLGIRKEMTCGIKSARASSLKHFSNIVSWIFGYFQNGRITKDFCEIYCRKFYVIFISKSHVRYIIVSFTLSCTSPNSLYFFPPLSLLPL